MLDEKGNPILVALQGTCLAQPQVADQNSMFVNNGGISNYQPSMSEFIDSNPLPMNVQAQYQENAQDPFIGGNLLENG